MKFRNRAPLDRLYRGCRNVGLAGCVLFVLDGTAQAQDSTWPRQIDFRNGTLVLYQPQPDSLNGNLLSGRAAVSFTAAGSSEPIFGTLWLTGRLNVDKAAGTAEVRNIAVIRARWPDVTDEQERSVTTELTQRFSEVVLPISTDRLSASLEDATVQRESLQGIKNDPPQIIFSQEVAELLLYDGQPRTIPIPNTDLKQVANAAFAVVQDGSDYYLSGGKVWYRASDPLGPWSPISAPPGLVADVVPPDTASTSAWSPPPKIIVATEPTELVVTQGPPDWQSIGSSGELLYVENTETPIVRDVSGNQVYILVSGRWFRSASFDGPWTFVRPDQLPKAFKDIPPASDLGGSRTSVPGTPEAEDAVLDNQVPQTAAIKRSEASFEVTYDGTPEFESIGGTDVAYAVNTGEQVLRIDGQYYACDSGVWFESASATGPWAVADSIPNDKIDEIPPSAPVYNVTNVKVYDSTPDVVYVGYTPGYMWSFPYWGVPVFGTGWYYPPYWGPNYFYPRPYSYGFHVGYNPWSGWSFGFSWSNGFMSVGFGFGGGYGGYYRPGWGPGWHGGYYPPGGYRGPVVINTGDINIGNRVNVGNRPSAGNRPGNLERPSLYDQGRNRDRVANPQTLRTSGQPRVDRVAPGPNNVLSDRQGNVYQRKPDGGWDARDGGQWKPSTPEGRQPQARPAQPSTRPETTRQVPQGVQQDYSARVRGAQRASARPAGGRGGLRR